MITLNFVGDNIGDYYSTEDYYQQREDKTGELLGAGVKAFGFDPTQRQHDQFTAHVADRVGITKKNGKYEQPRKALDLTFSPPKSVSILYGLAVEAGDHELAQNIIDNQKEAVRQTIKHMEEEGYFTTLVKDADGNVHRYKAVDLVFEMVETHLDNRDGQNQLHVHVLTANKCHAEGDPSEQERAVDFGYVMNNQKNIDFIEKQYEASGLEKMGFSVEMLRDKKRNESFRIAGITEKEEKVYSKRRAAIEENIEARLGKSIDQATAKEREYANKITRKSKKKDKSIDEMAKCWKADHEAAGLSLDIILERNRELVAQRAQEQSTLLAEQQQQHQQLSHATGIAPEKPAAPAPDPTAPDWWTTRDLTPQEAVEFDRLVEQFYTQHPSSTEEERYAFLRENWQPEIIDPKKEAARAALKQCEEMRGAWTEQSAYNEARKIAIAQNFSLTLDEFRQDFNKLKVEVGVKDLPGQDQSFIFKRFASNPVLEAEQYVLDTAANNKSIYDAPILDAEKAREFFADYAARQKEAKGYGPNAGQEGAFFNIVDHSQDFSVVLQGRAGTGKTTGVMKPLVEFVGADKVQGLSTGAAAAKQLGDAAGCESRTIASFLKRVEKGDADTISRISGGYILLDEAGMVSAQDMAAVKKVALAHGARIVECGDTAQLPPVGAGKPFEMVIERHAEASNLFELRDIVRQKNDAGIDKEATGALINILDDKTKEALQYYIDTDQLREVKDKNERCNLMVGTKVERMMRDADDGLGFTEREHDILTIVSTNAAREKINNGVRKELKEVGLLPKDQDVTVSVADRDGVLSDKKFCPGDHIVFLENNSNIGVQNSNLAQITAIDKQTKAITAKLEDGTEVSFDSKKYNRFDYGYALTTYKTQGATKLGTQYEADTKSPLLTSNDFYVGASRHERELIIWTDSKKKLAQKISNRAEKQSPLEEEEKGKARENGHKYVEAVEKAHETRKSADIETKNKQRRLTHSYQNDYKRVPREFRDMIDQEFESHRKQLSTELKAAKDKFGDKKDSVTKDMNKAIDKWHDNHEKIKVDGIRAEAVAKQKGAITKAERQAKKDAGPMPEWQREWQNRDPEARARAEQAKLVNSARRSHQSLDTRLADLHKANDKTFEKKLTEYTPRRQLAEELKRREELAAAKSDTPPIAAKDRPAHLAAEQKAAAVFAAIREAEQAQKETVKQIAADQREAKAAAEKAKQDFGPEQRKPFIQRYQAANAKFREDVKESVAKHCDSPEAGQAIHDALDRWQKGQDGIKKASTQNVKKYIKVRDCKQPAPTKSELSTAKAEFEKGNEHVKKLYKANKATLDKTFNNIKTYIKETELRKYYESTGRTPPETTIKPIRSKDQDGKETVSFRAPDQSKRKTRAEKEISDLVSEYRSLTDKPKHPFMRDLANTRDAWEADRHVINGDKAHELDKIKEKNPNIRELDGERQKHYRDRHAIATGKFKARVEELVVKHGGDQATAKKIMDSLKSWEHRQTAIRKESSSLYREPSGKARTPTPEEKTAIIAKYRDNDAKLDKDFDGIRKELDAVKKEKKKGKGKEVDPEKAQSREKAQAPKEKAIPDKADEFKNEQKQRDPEQIAAAIDQAIRQDENKFFDELNAAKKHGVAVDIPEHKTEVKGILVGQMRGKDGNKYAILATAPGKYSAVPATGDIAAMMGKPVLAGRGGIAAQGEAAKGSTHINNFMLCRGSIAKQFGSELGKLLQKCIVDDRGMELSI